MTRLDPIDRQLLDFLCSVEASRNIIVRSVKTRLRPSLRRLRYAGLVPFDSFTPSASAMADWRERHGSPPSPGGAASEEQPTPKAADAEGGAAARTVAAPPRPRKKRNTKGASGTARKAPGAEESTSATRTVGRAPPFNRSSPVDAEPAHYPEADRQERTAKRRSAAVRRSTTLKAKERIEQGLDPRTCKQASVRHAQIAIEREQEMQDRLATPLEQAKAKLQRRYAPVVSMAIYGGDADLFVVGRRKNVTQAELLAMARRIAA